MIKKIKENDTTKEISHSKRKENKMKIQIRGKKHLNMHTQKSK